jgi:hypothetical protein
MGKMSISYDVDLLARNVKSLIKLIAGWKKRTGRDGKW